MFLPDRLPAYITWEQFQRNQEQIRANRTSERGPTRASIALLSRADRVRPVRLAHDGHVQQRRPYGALPMHQHPRTSWDAPSCQALKAAPVDAEVARLILKALEPAAIEASGGGSRSGGGAQSAQPAWSQRLERAQHRGRSGPPPLRTASSPRTGWWPATLEQDWETALGEASASLGRPRALSAGAAPSA